MSEMIERVKKAIEAEIAAQLDEAGYMHSVTDEDIYVDGVVDLQRLAIAILEAMREPTDDMANASLSTWNKFIFRKPTSTGLWKAMIDAALAGEGE